MSFLQPVINWFSELSLAEWLGMAGFALALRNYFQTRHKHELDTLRPRLVEANDASRARIAALRQVHDHLNQIKDQLTSKKQSVFYMQESLGPIWEQFLDPTSDMPEKYKTSLSHTHQRLLSDNYGRPYKVTVAEKGIEKIQEAIDKETQGIAKRNQRLRKLNQKHKLSD